MNSELSAECLTPIPGRESLANRRDISRRQASARVVLPPCLPTLPDLVCVVVPHGSEKQVVRVDARRVVTVVQDTQAVRNWAIGKLPRHSVCEESGAATAIPFTKQSITLLVSAGSPLPAFVGATLVYLWPESLRLAEPFSRHGTTPLGPPQPDFGLRRPGCAD